MSTVMKPQQLKRISNYKMDPGLGEKLKFEWLEDYTNNFSEENFVGTFQFGKIYRGIYPNRVVYFDHVMVKMWEVPETYKHYQRDNLARVMNEIYLLQHEKLIQHPGMIEFLGFCWDGEHLGALYHFSPLDSVHNLVPKDTFTWLQRIKVALGFAHLLKFLHAGRSKYSPFLVRNIAAAHILVDKEYNPKLCDFGMIVGGFSPDETIYECNGCYGYVDPNIGGSGKWSEKTDVFAFGVVMLNLITKRVDKEEDRQTNAPLLYAWAWDLFESRKAENGSKTSMLSLVDQSLTTGPSFSFIDGCELTNLAMKCINRDADERPSMKQIVKYLLKLQIVKDNAEFLGMPPKNDNQLDRVVSLT